MDRLLLTELTTHLENKQPLSADQMRAALAAMMQAETPDEEIAAFLLALRSKGETPVEVAAAAEVVRIHMTPIRTNFSNHIDTCGTGGDGLSTFNISTAAALVVAAAGIPVAKHGNRSVTSKSGSADVLASLGVQIDAPLEAVENCLEEVGICFCFAPVMHPSLKRVAVIRRQLGVPTLFNWLGPLCNPALAPFQLMGVGQPRLRRMMAEVHQLLGTRHAVVVHGADGLDEVSIETETFVSIARGDEIVETVWRAASFGIAESPISSLTVDGPEESAEVIRAIFAGRPGPHRDIVVANAAAAIWTARPHDTLRGCAELAQELIDSGRVHQLVAELAEASQTPPRPV
ncbi:MAG: anthranilate phosphoribosyltransferase [Planctomycetota bacterium]